MWTSYCFRTRDRHYVAVSFWIPSELSHMWHVRCNSKGKQTIIKFWVSVSPSSSLVRSHFCKIYRQLSAFWLRLCQRQRHPSTDVWLHGDFRISYVIWWCSCTADVRMDHQATSNIFWCRRMDSSILCSIYFHNTPTQSPQTEERRGSRWVHKIKWDDPNIIRIQAFQMAINANISCPEERRA